MAEQPTRLPLGAPSANENLITVDRMLNQSPVIEKMVSDLTQERFIMDRIFSRGPATNSGAVISEVLSTNELYLSSDIEEAAAGSEAVILSGERLGTEVFTAREWKAAVTITEQARRRNDVSLFRREIQKLSNAFVRKNNQITLAALAAGYDTGRDVAPASTKSWSDAIALAPYSSTYTFDALPHYVLAQAKKRFVQEKLGIRPDTLIVHDNEALNLDLFYAEKLNGVLARFGISNLIVTDQITAGTAWILQSGEVGSYSVEVPFNTRTYVDQKTQDTFVESSTSWVPVVNNPFAAIRLTGLAA